MQDNVVKILKENMWDLATCANNEPNVVTVAFKDVTEDGKLIVGDVFLETTLQNLQKNDGKIAVTAYDAKTLEGYQIKGHGCVYHGRCDRRYLQKDGGDHVQRCCDRKGRTDHHARQGHCDHTWCR